MVYQRINDCIEYLNDSVIVFKVQNYFGVELLHKYDHDNDKDVIEVDHQKIETYDADKSNKEKKKNDNEKYKYRINNKFFYHFFSVVTQLGSEIFYITFLPLMAWLYDEKLTYLTCFSWAINMYLGQMTKELFQMPRPSTPPVIKLDKDYINEYGFPSTHAMAAMSITFTLLTLFFNTNNQIIDNSLKYLIISIALFIGILIGLSRMYLGMHSLLDVLGGLVYSLFISTLFVPCTINIDLMLQSSILYGLLFYSFGIFLCLLYPKANRESTARMDTFIIIGVASGISLGISLKYALGIPIGKFSNNLFNTSYSHIVLFRIIVGCIATFLTRLVCKKILFFVALNIFNYKRYFDDNQVIDVKQLVKKKYSFEFIYYFITYSSVSFTAIFTCSFLFEIFNLK